MGRGVRPDSVTHVTRALTEFGVGKLLLIKAAGMSIMAVVSSTTADGGGSVPWCTYKAGRPCLWWCQGARGALLAPAAAALPCHLPRLWEDGPLTARGTKAMAGLAMWLHATTSPSKVRTPRGTILCSAVDFCFFSGLDQELSSQRRVARHPKISLLSSPASLPWVGGSPTCVFRCGAGGRKASEKVWWTRQVQCKCF